MRTPQDMPRRLPRVSRRLQIGLIIAVVVVIVLIASLRGLAHFWTDYLWFQSVGFTSVFRGVLLTKVLLSIVFIAIFFFLMWGNLVIADRVAPDVVEPEDVSELTGRYRDFVYPRGRWVRLVVSAIFALLAGTGADREWNNWDLFRYHLSFGVKDPQFHKDVGFYVFQLPFIEFLIGWAFEAVIVVLIVTAVWHYLNGGLVPQSRVQRATSPVKAHLSVLLGVLALIKAVDYYFARLSLVLSRSHVVNGATATSVHAESPAKLLLLIIAVIAAVLFFLNIRQRGWMLPVVAVVLWGLVSVLLGDAYPAIYQAASVNPSELTKEAPYIQRNIDATQAAYGLTRSKLTIESSYQYSPTVTASQVGEFDNEQTLSNVRLLDPAVNLLNTFDKYQALRAYYSFNDLDLDRYDLNSGPGGQPVKTATVTSIRELNSNVPSGFVNQHLEYTHGYGAILAPISQSGVNGDGTPNFSLSELPPQGDPQLTGNGAQIYYGLGQDTSGYVIADTKTAELDYENTQTGQEVHSNYAGTGGVKAGSLIRRAAFALRFGDINFVLSGQITPSSRVLYIRNIVSRVQKAAPFLKFDADPYAVVLDNKVYWVLDAYTTTDNYPYSQNANTDRVPGNSGLQTTFNYVRNSVKVVVSAYDGSMYFFDMGTQDPILKVYERAFPDLFKPVTEADTLIPGIRAHFRYPEDIFTVQTNMYGRYHLSRASDFYTQAQAWAVSPDPGSGPLSQTQLGAATTAGTTTSATTQPAVSRLSAQYILAHLPGSTEQSFMLITPYVPIALSGGSQNLTAFITAGSDPDDYGQLRVFEMPPGQTVEGPSLISNAIRSNQVIAQELTLYDQHGSMVELGEVAIVPIDQTLLYVEPVYVESSTNGNPTLRDVVVVYDGQAYHSGNASLDNALCQVQNPAPPVGDGTKPFASYCNTAAAVRKVPTTTPGGAPAPSTTTTTTIPQQAGGTVSSLLAQAQASFAAAQTALKDGNLAAYQADNQKAMSYVVQAQQLLAKPPSKG